MDGPWFAEIVVGVATQSASAVAEQSQDPFEMQRLMYDRQMQLLLDPFAMPGPFGPGPMGFGPGPGPDPMQGPGPMPGP